MKLCSRPRASLNNPDAAIATSPTMKGSFTVTTLQQQLDTADLAGYAAAEKLNMPSIPGSYALEAGEEARRWLMEKYKKEFDAFCDGFERHNKERYREATNA